MNPMSTAPKNCVILVRGRGVGWRRAYFVDCEWLRNDDPSIGDCWRFEDGSGRDIELDDAMGWRPAKDRMPKTRDETPCHLTELG